MIHIWHWIMDFLGVNNTYDTFSTKMYNFWSGFGGGIIQFSLLGALAAFYHHFFMHNKVMEMMEKKLPIPHHEEQTPPESKSDKK